MANILWVGLYEKFVIAGPAITTGHRADMEIWDINQTILARISTPVSEIRKITVFQIRFVLRKQYFRGKSPQITKVAD